MFIVDDPMLALIMRFVGGDRQLDISDEKFLHGQITAVQEFVSKYPSEQKNSKALEWIAKYARKYRQEWQRDVVSRALYHTRCPDCPLIKRYPVLHCAIHQEWLELLQRYVERDIDSMEYVESSLNLVQEHKSELKVTLLANIGHPDQGIENNEISPEEAMHGENGP